jgi:hypothetical protein
MSCIIGVKVSAWKDIDLSVIGYSYSKHTFNDRRGRTTCSLCFALPTATAYLLTAHDVPKPNMLHFRSIPRVSFLKILKPHLLAKCLVITF